MAFPEQEGILPIDYLWIWTAALQPASFPLRDPATRASSLKWISTLHPHFFLAMYNRHLRKNNTRTKGIGLRGGGGGGKNRKRKEGGKEREGDGGGRKRESIELKKKDHRLKTMPSNCLENSPSKEISRQSFFDARERKVVTFPSRNSWSCPKEQVLTEALHFRLLNSHTKTEGHYCPWRPRGDGSWKGPTTSSFSLSNLNCQSCQSTYFMWKTPCKTLKVVVRSKSLYIVYWKECVMTSKCWFCFKF